MFFYVLFNCAEFWNSQCGGGNKLRTHWYHEPNPTQLHHPHNPTLQFRTSLMNWLLAPFHWTDENCVGLTVHATFVLRAPGLFGKFAGVSNMSTRLWLGTQGLWLHVVFLPLQNVKHARGVESTFLLHKKHGCTRITKSEKKQWRSWRKFCFTPQEILSQCSEWLFFVGTSLRTPGSASESGGTVVCNFCW